MCEVLLIPRISYVPTRRCIRQKGVQDFEWTRKIRLRQTTEEWPRGFFALCFLEIYAQFDQQVECLFRNLPDKPRPPLVFRTELGPAQKPVLNDILVARHVEIVIF